MVVNINFFLAGNPFLDAYLQSDLVGRLIFIGLFALSVLSWVLIIQKTLLTYRAKKSSHQFRNTFIQQRSNPLAIDLEEKFKKSQSNPYLDLYSVLKRETLEVLNKNRRFGSSETHPATLSTSDIDYINTFLNSSIAMQVKGLEKNLFYLSSIVSLGPFLGLLGTVWGILITFSDLQAQTGASSSQLVLGGLSLALATTVLGLLDAIPAIIGYNYLKNSIHAFQVDMEGFSTEILASVEMQYRRI